MVQSITDLKNRISELKIDIQYLREEKDPKIKTKWINKLKEKQKQLKIRTRQII